MTVTCADESGLFATAPGANGRPRPVLTPRPEKPGSPEEHQRQRADREAVLDRLTGLPKTWAQRMCLTEVSIDVPAGTEVFGGQHCYQHEYEVAGKVYRRDVYRALLRHPLDTQPANQGAELLAKLARMTGDLAGASPEEIAASLTGASVFEPRSATATVPGSWPTRCCCGAPCGRRRGCPARGPGRRRTSRSGA